MLASVKRHIRLRAVRKRAAILTYHSIVNEPLPIHPWIHLRSSQFEQQVAFLARHYNVVSLSTLLMNMREKRVAPRTVALTFDDGFSNNYSTAFPILRKYKVPATIFVTAGLVDTDNIIWTDTLACLLERLWNSEVDFLGVHYSLCSPDDALAAYRAIVSVLKTYHPAMIGREVAGLLKRTGITTEDLRDTVLYRNTRMLTRKQLEEMHASGLIEIGSHTLDHAIVSRLTDQEAYRQLLESKRTLEQYLGEIRSFAYPNGGEGDFSGVHRAMAEGVGYSAVLTSITGMVTYDSDPLQLPRIGVGRDMTIDELDYLLSGGAVFPAQRLREWISAYITGY